jgi:hypothetical protein
MQVVEDSETEYTSYRFFTGIIIWRDQITTKNRSLEIVLLKAP